MPWVAGLLAAAVLARVAGAMPVAVGSASAEASSGVAWFPILVAERDARDGSTAWTFLGPIGHFQHADGRTLAAFRPLGSYFREGRSSGWDVLYPFVGARRSPDLARRWVFPFWFWTRRVEGESVTARAVLFPLYYAGWRGDTGARYRIVLPVYWDIEPGARLYVPLFAPSPGRSWAVLPLYGRFRGLWGADDVTTVLWPLWVQSVSGADRYWSVLWPIVRVSRGPDLHGWRVWPLVGMQVRDGVGSQGFFLWPLGHAVERRADGARPALSFHALLPFYFRLRQGRQETAYYFPFYGFSESPSEHTDRWLWPLWSRTRHRNPDWTEDRFLWLLGRYRRGGETRVAALWPLFSAYDAPDRTSRAWLWPIAQSLGTVEPSGRRFERVYVLPFYFHQRWVAPSGEMVRERRALWPLFRSVRRADGSSEWACLHLGWFIDDEGLARNWAPLWTLYRRSDDGQGVTEQSLFGRLWRRRAVDGRTQQWEVNFLLGRLEKAADRSPRLTLLGLSWTLGHRR